MTLSQGLGDFLLVNASIAALVGTRLYAGLLPQKVDLTSGRAAIVLSDVDDIGSYHNRGPNAQSRARWQVDCWAQTKDVANNLGRYCRWRLSGFKGTWVESGSPENTITVQMIRRDDQRNVPEAEILGGLYRHSADYFITYSASEDTVLI